MNPEQTKREDLIRREVEKRLLRAMKRKARAARRASLAEALAEVSSLTKQEIEDITQEVRTELETGRTRRRMLRRRLVAGLTLVILLAVLYAAHVYNGLADRREQTYAAWAQVENVMQRRLDLMPRLIELAAANPLQGKRLVNELRMAWREAEGVLGRQELDEEEEDLTAVRKAHERLENILWEIQQVGAEGAAAFDTEGFRAMQAQIEGAANRIAVERRRYNAAVRAYNVYGMQFPRNMLARLYGQTALSYFRSGSKGRK